MSVQPWCIRKAGKEVLGQGRASWRLYRASERGRVVDGEQLSAGRVVVEVGKPLELPEREDGRMESRQLHGGE